MLANSASSDTIRLVDRSRDLTHPDPAVSRAAAEAILTHFVERRTRLCRKMLRPFRVDWEHRGAHVVEDTGDVVQEASMEFLKAVRSSPPVDSLHFFRMASQALRWEMTRLARYYSAQKRVRQVVSIDAAGADGRPLEIPAESEHFEAWEEFHLRVQELPEDIREVFELSFYQGLNQSEIGGLLGINERTVGRRLSRAMVDLGNALRGLDLEL